MTRYDTHLESETIQEFLDRELSSSAEIRVRSHLESCASCRAEVEAWEGVFASLGAMDELAPSPALSAEVLEAVGARERRSILDRIRDWLPSLPGRSDHPAPAVLQSFVDGALGRRKAAAVEAHAETCPACASELARWGDLVQGLAALERTAPSPGFADRVMAQVRVPEARARRAVARADGADPSGIRRLLPRSRKAWAMASVPMVVPAAAMTLGIVALFSTHPLLTPGSAISYFWWQMTGAANAGLAWIFRSMIGNPLALDVVQGMEAFVVDQVRMRSAAILLTGAVVASLWILYRNLTTTPPVDRGYVNGSA